MNTTLRTHARSHTFVPDRTHIHARARGRHIHIPSVKNITALSKLFGVGGDQIISEECSFCLLIFEILQGFYRIWHGGSTNSLFYCFDVLVKI